MPVSVLWFLFWLPPSSASSIIALLTRVHHRMYVQLASLGMAAFISYGVVSNVT